MIVLDATTKSLELVLAGAVTTNQLPFVASYLDGSTAGANDGATNNTTAVTAVAAPRASVQRQVKFLGICNVDTVAATVTVRYNNNGTLRTLANVALSSGSHLIYTESEGWRVFDLGGQFLTKPGGGSLVRGYAATLSDVVNTTTETTVLSFTVPANDWADGDDIEVTVFSLEKNNKGSSGTVTAKVNVGSGAQVTIDEGLFTMVDGASEKQYERGFWLRRVGSTVYMGSVVGSAGFSSARYGFCVSGTNGAYGSSTPSSFTSDVVVSLKLTLSAAHVTFYYKPQKARIRKFSET